MHHITLWGRECQCLVLGSRVGFSKSFFCKTKFINVAVTAFIDKPLNLYPCLHQHHCHSRLHQHHGHYCLRCTWALGWPREARRGSSANERPETDTRTLKPSSNSSSIVDCCRMPIEQEQFQYFDLRGICRPLIHDLWKDFFAIKKDIPVCLSKKILVPFS